jgi:peptide/nickel transport system ATP-binding protein
MAGSGTAHLRPGEALLRVEHLVVTYDSPGGRHAQAVSDVSFDVLRGETLGLVGESGCGKSTTANAIVQLPRPTAGQVFVDGEDITKLRGEDLRRIRTRVQMILQDPIASLNPRRPVRDVVAEPMTIWGFGDAAERRARVDELLRAVGLDPGAIGPRRSGELSGGQCQRVCIARALALEPQLLICDEPVSALDVSVQAKILNLLGAMKARYALTMLFIGHDLAVVRHVSDRVAVMYLGKLCEIAPAGALYAAPRHPYTAALLHAIPTVAAQPDTTPHDGIKGEPPSPFDPPSGCRFRTRCPRAAERCALEEPIIREIASEHYVACHFPLESESQSPHLAGTRAVA